MNPRGLRRVDLELAARNDLPPTWGKVCTAVGCTRPKYARGLCRAHDYRQRTALKPETHTGKDTARSQASYAPLAGARACKSTLRNPCLDPQWEPQYDGPDRAREAERLELLIAEVERRRKRSIEERRRLETEADLRMVERRLRGDA